MRDLLKKSSRRTIKDATQGWNLEEHSNGAGGGGAGGTLVVGRVECYRGNTPDDGPARVILADRSKDKVESCNPVSGQSASKKTF